MNAAHPKLRVKGATKVYSTRSGDLLAIDRCSLDVMDGEIVSIVGPSGCGKTTLLWSMSGLHGLSAGEVLLDGIQQVVDWYDEALIGLTEEQVNHHPGGLGMSIGWNAWHWYRTVDNITHLIFKGEKPLWITQGYFEKLDLDGALGGLDDGFLHRILLRFFAAMVTV